MPKTHIKPTQEELDAKIKESVETLEKEDKDLLEKVSNPPKVEEESPSETITPPVPSEEPKEEPVDYEKKYKASSGEAQILLSKTKKITEAVAKAGEIAEPTDEEMTKEFPDWEVMSDTERKLAKDSVVNRKKFSTLAEATGEIKDIDAWNDKVDSFLADPKVLADHPDLDGNEEEFKTFATKPTRRGVDFEDLVSSFLYMQSKEVRPKNKGGMFETGSAGLNDKPKPKTDKITVDESRRLRLLDYKKYLQYVKEGKIEEPEL
jgi:hypothetical protein